MSKTSRLHKIIRHCVDQTGAQKVVFVGPENDVRPYLGDSCIINTGETDLFDADVLVYVGNDPVQRPDLVESAKVVIVDESDSHDRNIGIDRGTKKAIHLETRHGRQFSLDRSYPPAIIYTHVGIDGIFDLAGYRGDDACEPFVTIGFFNTSPVGGYSGEPSHQEPDTTIPTPVLELEPVVEDQPTTTTARPVEEPSVEEEPVNDGHETSTTIASDRPTVEDSDGSTTALSPPSDDSERSGSETADGVEQTTTTELPSAVDDGVHETDVVIEEQVDVTTTTIEPESDGHDSVEPTSTTTPEPQPLDSGSDREQMVGERTDVGEVEDGQGTTTTLEPSVESDTSTTPLPRGITGDDSTVEGTTSTTAEPHVDDDSATTTTSPAGTDAEIPVEHSIDEQDTTTTVLPDASVTTEDRETPEVPDATTTTDTTTTDASIVEPVHESETTTTQEPVDATQPESDNPGAVPVVVDESTTTTTVPVNVELPTETTGGSDGTGGIIDETTTTTLEPVNETTTTSDVGDGENDVGNVEDGTTTTEVPVSTESVETSDTTSTPTPMSPRELASWLLQNKPFGKMTPEEKQLLHDEGLV